MSCLRIKLSPAKSAWKRFASKLMKLQRSKPIKKKLTTRPVLATAVKPVRKSDHHLPRLRKHRTERRPHVLLLRLKRACMFKKKRHAVVYVDKLFRPVVAPRMEEKNVEEPREMDDDADVAWEAAMGLASPLVHGIDDRAEEFIARIKAEMRSQDKIDRAL